MKRFLIPLLTALAIPSVNAEELIELKPVNPHSYKQSTLVRWEENGRRYLTFKGTSFIPDCYGVNGDAGVNFTCGYDPENIYRKRKATSLINKDGWKTVLFEYDVDCIEKTYNRGGDVQNWHGLIVDQTPFLVAQKYCPLEEWSKLPNK
tara:strand:+ start:124 stop:570 length:447 start_codon:yes stop_codon:yes gene_type:complete